MRKILVEFEFDDKYWEDYKDVIDELVLSDAGIDNFNTGVYYHIVDKPYLEFIKNIDWNLLREQKAYLINTGIETEPMDGIIHLIDALQDYSVDTMGLSEKEVFDLTPEEE